MNSKHYNYILYIITVVIITTIGIQIYWNYKNYLTNKQQLINDVQISLDKAVDDYYAALAEKTTLGFSFYGDGKKEVFGKEGQFSKFLKSIDETKSTFKRLDSLDTSKIDNVTVLRGFKADSMMKNHNQKHKPLSVDSYVATVKAVKSKNDTTDLSNIELLTSKVLISINNDSLDLKEVEHLLKEELKRKSINIKHKLSFFDFEKDTSFCDSINKNINDSSIKRSILSTTSKSTFLPSGSILKIDFENETRTILKRIISGVLISTLLILAVISCLFYLLKIINKQKQLAEVKNDLISNITHEFKTPIATIGVAIESIKDFNVIDNKEKTKKYLNLSTNQLSKLNIMVEKLLETATLDSDNLDLNKEYIDIAHLLYLQVEKHQIQTQKKQLKFNTSPKEIIARIDGFHFENAINNVIDNAVKYGGNYITVNIIEKKNNIRISISDNGNSLTQEQSNQIFEKFYRVPKGNTHDIKGFGIGLYYTKKIIEKHGGSISIDLSKNTTFNIIIPNEQ